MKRLILFSLITLAHVYAQEEKPQTKTQPPATADSKSPNPPAAKPIPREQYLELESAAKGLQLLNERQANAQMTVQLLDDQIPKAKDAYQKLFNAACAAAGRPQGCDAKEITPEPKSEAKPAEKK